MLLSWIMFRTLYFYLAFFDGWYSDEKCLARQGNEQRQNYVLEIEQIIHVTGPSDVIDLLENGEVSVYRSRQIGW